MRKLGIGKYIPYIQNTTYFKSMLRGLKECYGMKEFTLSECERVNELLKKGVDTEALFREHNIRRAMTFVGYYGIEYFSDSKVLVPVPTVSYMAPKSEEEIRILEKESGEKVTGLDGLKRAIGAMFAVYRKCGLKNIKIGSAYNRTLDYDVPDTDRAEEQLLRVQRGEFSGVRLYGQNNQNLPMAGLKDLDNFVIWECAGQARKAVSHDGADRDEISFRCAGKGRTERSCARSVAAKRISFARVHAPQGGDDGVGALGIHDGQRDEQSLSHAARGAVQVADRSACGNNVPAGGKREI